MSPTLALAQKVTALSRTLESVPHAFGGALALAYYAEPRATVDIDLNLFVPPDRYDEVEPLLRRLGVDTAAGGIAEVFERDGQGRLFWDGTPLDLFFADDAFHDAAARAKRRVPFADGQIWILAADHLTVAKVVFDRPKDWVDIDAVLAAGAPVDAGEVLRWVGRIAGPDDARFTRLARVLAA